MQDHRVTRLKFTRYINRQKTLDKTCNELQNGKRTLFALGDVRFSGNSPIKGHRRFPHARLVKCLKQRGDVILIDEFRTSKLCSKCFRQLEANGGRRDR